MIIDGNLTVNEVIQQLEQSIQEQTTFLKSLKKMVGLEEAKPNGNGNAKKVEPKAATEKDISNSPSADEKPTTATRAFVILDEKKVPMLQTEIRDLLKESGVDTTGENFLTALYTAMTRKPEWFVRLKDSRWALVKWNIEALNAAIDESAKSGDQLFETV